MTKFSKVEAALKEATRASNNYLRLKKGKRDARDNESIKYYTQNVITNNSQASFETLKQVIDYYNLKI